MKIQDGFLIYAKYEIWLHSIFWKKWGKMNFFTQNINLDRCEFHQNRYQCVNNLILFYMTLHLRWFDNSIRFYLSCTICHKRGNNFGRPLEFRGDPNKFSKAHLWNIVSDNIIFQKSKVCLVCTEATLNSLTRHLFWLWTSTYEHLNPFLRIKYRIFFQEINILFIYLLCFLYTGYNPISN